MAFGPKFTFTYIYNPFKAETPLNRTFCLIPRASGIEGFHCISFILIPIYSKTLDKRLLVVLGHLPGNSYKVLSIELSCVTILKTIVLFQRQFSKPTIRKISNVRTLAAMNLYTANYFM